MRRTTTFKTENCWSVFENLFIQTQSEKGKEETPSLFYLYIYFPSLPSPFSLSLTPLSLCPFLREEISSVLTKQQSERTLVEY